MLGMTLRRQWDPWQELRELEEALGWTGTGRRGDFPPVNIRTDEDAVVLTAEVPGVDPGGLDISVKGNRLTLGGTRKAEVLAEGESYIRRERWEGDFSRMVELPYNVEAEKVEAVYRNGVLTIRLPRAEAERPRKIAVSAAE